MDMEVRVPWPLIVRLVKSKSGVRLPGAAADYRVAIDRDHNVLTIAERRAPRPPS